MRISTVPSTRHLEREGFQVPQRNARGPALAALRKGVLQSFGAAWDAKDLDKLMSFVTEDCVYSASIGPEPGQTLRGRDAVRPGLGAMLIYDASGESHGRCAVVLGHIGLVEWAYARKDSDGKPVSRRSCSASPLDTPSFRACAAG